MHGQLSMVNANMWVKTKILSYGLSTHYTHQCAHCLGQRPSGSPSAINRSALFHREAELIFLLSPDQPLARNKFEWHFGASVGGKGTGMEKNGFWRSKDKEKSPPVMHPNYVTFVFFCDRGTLLFSFFCRAHYGSEPCSTNSDCLKRSKVGPRRHPPLHQKP